MWLRPKTLVTRSRRFLKPHIFFPYTCGRGLSLVPSGGGGEGVLSMMAYTGRLRPTGLSFSGFRHMKG